MKPNDPHNVPWQAIEPGLLVQFAAREKAKETRRRVIRVAGPTAVVVLAGIWFGLRGFDSTEPNYGGIRCSAVQSKAKDHLAGKLDTATNAKITQHLQQCPMCASFMKQAANAKNASHVGRRIHYVTTKPQLE